MQSGKSSADSYWPGFVDALTNVVIAMIFVVVVLAISLSFAAQMMGKQLAEQYIKEHTEKLAKSAKAQPQTPVAQEAAPPDTTGATTTRIAVAVAPAASAPAAAQVRNTRNRLQLDYAPGAFTLDASAETQLRASLTAQIGGNGAAQQRVELLARGPDLALSDNQRAAYVRLMAVRNTLLDAGFSADRVTVRIDAETAASTPSVFVNFKD
jgi:hypothetical protein